MNQFAEVLARRVTERPGGPAIVQLGSVGAQRTITWSELADEVAVVADRLRRAARRWPAAVACFTGGTDAGTVVSVIGALCAGVTFFPMPARSGERDRLLDVAAQVGRPVDAVTGLPLRPASAGRPGPAGASVLLATSGSTGPRNVVAHAFDPSTRSVGFRLLFDSAGWQPRQRHLLTLPCSHIGPLQAAARAVLDRNTLVLANPVGPELLDVVAEQRINWLLTTPHHMARALDHGPRGWDLGAVTAVLHTGSWCPPQLKRTWLELLGPERVFEMYGATEAPGMTFVDGRTWLRRPGTVGRGFLTRLRIRDTAGRDLAPGEVGEVFMKTFRPGTEIGPRKLFRSSDGYVGTGDRGWCDADGHLFLTGRASEAVAHAGGTAWINELEAALLQHDAVVDAEVVSRGAARLGLVLVIAPGARCPDRTELERRLCAAGRGALEVSSVELVGRIPRSPMGKRSTTTSRREP